VARSALTWLVGGGGVGGGGGWGNSEQTHFFSGKELIGPR